MDRDITDPSAVVWRRLKPLLPARSSAPQGSRPWADDERCLIGIV